ncbi:hypothetical protein [Actinacidiphila sp. ITFR-21]|uniref:hypothetical protein n=1 Tax=Actinacidiphila sp. ITFR-21 TaxID=3075199 RepID=UPI00288C0A73|nr:hypothetical protein [Streptomyces sp. ITFR-21]WNI15230.1 hypothetical protein RLT57_06555 [Streptomyces sp. ITFR-21]
MEHSTGGHWRDTGEGLVSVELPTIEQPPADRPARVFTGGAAESPRNAAYRTYLSHVADCPQCTQSVFRCADGDRLWDAYTAAR